MRIYPTIELKQTSKMGDFAYWGYAIAKAVDFNREIFLDAYADNIGQHNEEALTSMPMGEVVTGLMQETDEWQGTPWELLSALEQKAASLRLNTPARTWPEAANAVTRRMNEIRANLEQAGIEIDSGKGVRGAPKD